MNFSGEGAEGVTPANSFAAPERRQPPRTPVGCAPGRTAAPILARRPDGENHPQLDPVLEEALRQPSSKDALLRMERGVQDFLKDTSCAFVTAGQVVGMALTTATACRAQRFTLPPMGSYHRLMVHRLAEYYCMEHDVEEWTSQEDQRRDRQPMTLYKTPGSQM